MQLYSSLVNFFQLGGAFMYPIALLLVIGLAIAIERWVFLEKARRLNKNAFEKIMPLVRKKDFSEVRSVAEKTEAPIARIVYSGIERMENSPNREEVEFAMEEGVLETVPKLNRRTGYIAILANVSTLMGLLGTIVGLIAAFTAVANADPAEKATLLSQSISVAMNTTAFGLVSAIPLLLIHAYLTAKTAEIVDSIEMAGVKFLNAMSFSPVKSA